jgi:raffinose/stachyose/melibiose transport system permease protein
MTKRKHVTPEGVLLSIFALVWSVLTIYPFIVTVMSSLKTNDEIFGAMTKLPETLRFENYLAALTQANMGQCILNSVYLSALSTVILIVCASLTSFVFARTPFKGTKWLYMLFVFGIILPIHATLIPLAKMISSLPFLHSNSYGTLTLIYVAFQLPISVFIITGYMKGISKELDEAAEMDGCSLPRLFFQIILPVSKPAVATSAIISFLFFYNELIFAVVFLSDKAKYTISLGMLQFVGYRTVQMGPIFASIVVSIIPMIVIYLLFQNQVQHGMVAGAVKE